MCAPICDHFATRLAPPRPSCICGRPETEILAVSNLTNILRGMGRFEAAAVIEQQIHWKSQKFIESQQENIVKTKQFWYWCCYGAEKSWKINLWKQCSAVYLKTKRRFDTVAVIEHPIHWKSHTHWMTRREDRLFNFEIITAVYTVGQKHFCICLLKGCLFSSIYFSIWSFPFKKWAKLLSKKFCL